MKTNALLLRAALLCCSLALPFSANSGMVTSAQQTGYLQDYHRMNHVGGVPLEQVWIEPHLDVRTYRALYIPPTRIDPAAYYAKGAVDKQAAELMAAHLHANLVKELQAAGIFQFVTSDPFFAAKRREYITLETRITEINSGDPERRYRPGFGAGATTIQIEGKLIENRTCRLLVEFADRRNHPGDALWVGRRNSANSDYLLALDTNGILRGVVKLFIYLREEGMPANQR